MKELRIVFYHKKNDYKTVLLLETGIYDLPPVHCLPQLTSLVLLNNKDQDRYEWLHSSSHLAHSTNLGPLKTHWNNIRPFPSVRRGTIENGRSKASKEQHSSEILSIKDPTFMQKRQVAAEVRVVDCTYYEEVIGHLLKIHYKPDTNTIHRSFLKSFALGTRR